MPATIDHLFTVVPAAVGEPFDEHRLALFLGAVGLVVIVSGLVSGLVERGPLSQVLVVVALGVAVGPFVIGALHDVLGGYGAAFSLAALASVVAAGVLAVSGPTRGTLPVVSPAAA